MIENLIAVVVIPFIVELLKKIQLPAKVAPIAAVVLAVIYVAVAKALGLAGAEFATALEFITKALGIGGMSVLGYDLVKKFTD